MKRERSKQNTYTDYEKYELKGKELLFYLAVYVAVMWAGMWLFYKNHGICMLMTVAGVFIYIKRVKAYLVKKRIKALEKDFIHMMTQISASLAAGMTLQNSLRDYIDTEKNKKTCMFEEAENIYKLVLFRYSFESAFENFAKRSGSKDIKMFCSALKEGLPTGINQVELIRSVTVALRMKYDIEDEVSKSISLPKYNNRVLIAMAFLCIAIVNMIAPGYISVLYSGKGRVVMAGVMILMALAIILGEKLGKIKYVE